MASMSIVHFGALLNHRFCSYASWQATRRPVGTGFSFTHISISTQDKPHCSSMRIDSFSMISDRLADLFDDAFSRFAFTFITIKPSSLSLSTEASMNGVILAIYSEVLHTP